MASSLNQSISAKTQNQIVRCNETKKVYSWIIPHCKPELKETTSWTKVGHTKDIRHQAPTHLWKLYVEAVIVSKARPAVIQLKSET